MIILVIFKKFDKRSLVLGNFIALSTICELGSTILFLIYIYFQTTNITVQVLSFILIVSKFIFNFFFLLYFILKLSKDSKYTSWL